ncbi:C-terminal binding protein [Anaerosalibacter massiliensis]|uniref:C-terminal binding protein n=1 Tax=Anaerosalibacter massiliensis TaxID=1347392 RepID=UPI0006786466|nr:C-terminal binding protein [Anaerosalibacter massiliensis]
MSEKFNVVVHSLIVDEPDIEEKILSPIADIRFIPNDNKYDFYKAILKADGIIIADREIDSNAINKMKRCKVISRQGVGIDNIDVNEAKKRNIVVANIPDYCTEDVANYTVASILSITRHIHIYNKHVKEGLWSVGSVFSTNKFPPIRRISTQTLGVVGYGRIARSVIKKMKNFNVNILVYYPRADKRVENKEEIEFVDFKTLLRSSDIITLHVPLTKHTKYMFDIEAFKIMKRTSFLVNTSRGSVVNEKALYIALKERLIAGAAIDVMEEEPPKKDNPLLNLDNIIITPHMAFLSKDSYEEMRRKAAENVKNILLHI